MNPSTKPPAVRVAIAGVGMTPVGEHWETSLRHLSLQAIAAAREDAGGLRPQALYVANMLAPGVSGQTHLGALLADFAGLRGIEAMSIEAAGASGGAALRQAYLAIASGEIEAAMVVGVEKVTDRVGAPVASALATATDADFEAVQGITPAAQASILMRRYLHEGQAPADALAGFSVVAHENGAHNPLAMYRKAIRREDYARAARISDPLNLFDAAPLADGAAALLLVPAGRLPARHDRPEVVIAGSALVTSSLALHDQENPLLLAAAAESTQQAYSRAGVRPDDIDVFELHDSFSIFAALELEASGFAPSLKGWSLAADGDIRRDGKIPISTFGGSKARGEPGGATGVYQAAEVTLQLQGRAGGNQVAEARIGMCLCLGTFGATAATHILQATSPG